MNKQQQKTLKAVFETPVPSNLEWRRIEALFITLGAQVRDARHFLEQLGIKP